MKIHAIYIKHTCKKFQSSRTPKNSTKIYVKRKRELPGDELESNRCALLNKCSFNNGKFYNL